MTMTEYMTPKRPTETFRLPTCPPAPRPPQQAAALGRSLPALSIPDSLGDDVLISADDAIGRFLAGVKRSTAKSSLGKRGRDGRPSLASIKLKPRPSKYVPPSRPANAATGGANKAGLHSLARSSSFQLLMNGAKKPRLTRRPSFSRAA